MLRTVHPEFQQPQSEGTEVLNQENILSTIQRVHDKSHLGIQNTWAKLRLQYEGYQMFAMKDAQPKNQHPTNTNGNYHLKIIYNRALRTSRPYPPLSDGRVDTTEHEIIINADKPIRSAPYRLGWHEENAQ
ncbi:hypothetical protein BC943DRAFT_363404 [Umbelopsis sp. AD052]|nr:hypothetical protein BC943DRAFT_363404 [Umbelopsis sp. AD052]